MLGHKPTDIQTDKTIYPIFVKRVHRNKKKQLIVGDIIKAIVFAY